MIRWLAALVIALVLLPSMGIGNQVYPVPIVKRGACGPESGLATHKITKNVPTFSFDDDYEDGLLFSASFDNILWDGVLDFSSEGPITIRPYVLQKFDAVWNEIFVLFQIKANPTVKIKCYVPSGGLSAVSANNVQDGAFLIVQANPNFRNYQICPDLELPHSLRIFDGFGTNLIGRCGGLSSFHSFLKHPLSVLGGNFGLIKSAFNQPDAKAGKANRYDRCKKHEFCPKGHIALGFQILYLVLGGAFLLGGSLLIYKLADRGFDLTKRGSELLGWGSILLAFSLGPLLIGGFLTLGYGLVFENGWLLFLGQGQTGP